MTRIFCDVNVMVDHYVRRLPWHVEADAIVAAARAGQIVLCVSSLSVAHLHYLTRPQVGLAAARGAVRDCLALCEILTVDRTILEQADLMAATDFEDNVQVACAVHAGVDVIVTRDPRGFAHSPVPVSTPADLVMRLSGPPTP